ncbi:uncharacterized protein LOC111713662 isoform X2 [Eurytemora carolleeae]|uniref:uncharacterized protein LOC111713662 isoform X2 n=1 Tax=Eurytemora carolleeae TaxID=1294199 RepID=UPI000C7723A0|nr:uncharacterized protein LOC111713662 isoform X2 [Eurytemora carolleeae]|eukprot:XP_023344355.1 uncharacterized protein LOC111713662 isoform X2 [Eurytemora affinis]
MTQEFLLIFIISSSHAFTLSEEKLARHWVQPPQFNNQSIKHLINHNLFKNFLKIDGGTEDLSHEISAVLSQLEINCEDSTTYRGLNVQLSCPADRNILYNCYCLKKNKQGRTIYKTTGETTFDECHCGQVGKNVVTRITCCKNVDGFQTKVVPQLQAELVYCTATHPVQTTKRSLKSTVRCGNNSILTRCFCIFPYGMRQLGVIEGSTCTCPDRRTKLSRAVCCGLSPDK